jgi:hypothetical protein
VITSFAIPTAAPIKPSVFQFARPALGSRPRPISSMLLAAWKAAASAWMPVLPRQFTECSRRGRRCWSRKKRRGSLAVPFARATRGLRRVRGSRQTVLLARRAPTIKRWSLDARSEEQSAYSLWGSWRVRRPSPGLMARLGVSVGGRVRKLRAVGDHPAHPLRKTKRILPDPVPCSRTYTSVSLFRGN